MSIMAHTHNKDVRACKWNVKIKYKELPCHSCSSLHRFSSAALVYVRCWIYALLSFDTHHSSGHCHLIFLSLVCWFSKCTDTSMCQPLKIQNLKMHSPLGPPSTITTTVSVTTVLVLQLLLFLLSRTYQIQLIKVIV